MNRGLVRVPAVPTSSGYPWLAGVVRSSATVAILAAGLLALQSWMTARHPWHPASVAAAALLAPLGVLILLLGLTAIVFSLRPKQTMREALLVAGSSDTVLALMASRPLLALISAAALSFVAAARSLWSELSDRRGLVLGRGLLITSGLAFIGLFLIERPTGVLLGLAALGLLVILLTGFSGLVLLVRNAPLPFDPQTDPVQAVFDRYAASGVSPFALMADKHYFWSRDRRAFLAYAGRCGVAIGLGPGIGPADALPRLYSEFRDECHRRGWRLGFYQVPGAMADALAWCRRYRIGREALVDLTALTLEGPTMAKLRHEVSRGRRNGVTIQVLPAADIPDRLRQEMRILSERQRRLLGAMSFSVGRAADPPRVPTVVGIARDATGRLVAYSTWLRVAAAGGIVLDQIKRDANAAPGAMHLLLYTCLEQLRSTASWASLGLAPAAGPASTSLLSFKKKFQPRWEERYLVAERLADWPAMAMATFRVHYPSLEERFRRLPPAGLRLLHQVAFAALG